MALNLCREIMTIGIKTEKYESIEAFIQAEVYGHSVKKFSYVYIFILCF